MKAEEFSKLLFIYKKHHDSVRLKNPTDPPTIQESVWAYGLEAEFSIISLRMLATVIYDAKADSIPFEDIDLDMINKMTAEQIYAACQFLLGLKQQDILDICSKFQEFS